MIRKVFLTISLWLLMLLLAVAASLVFTGLTLVGGVILSVLATCGLWEEDPALTNPPEVKLPEDAEQPPVHSLN